MGYSRGMQSYYDAVEILETVLVQDGIKTGKPLSKRAAAPPYDFRAMMVPVGAINAADSLAAIKKLVFEEKKITLKQLKQATTAGKAMRKSAKCACRRPSTEMILIMWTRSPANYTTF
jgi:pyruvate-formate lyase